MRLPSGATAAPWFTSIPVITPTTLFVAGSMTWTLSPALLVWMIRTLLLLSAALEDRVHRRTPAKIVRYHRNACVLVIVVNSFLSRSSMPGVRGKIDTPLVPRLSKHKRFQRLPFRVVLRLEVLASIVKEIATGLLLERVDQQSAVQAARHEDPLHRREVLARFL